MLSKLDPIKALVALGIVAAMTLIVLKAPAQLTPFAAAVGGVVLALMNLGKPKDGDS